MPFSFYKILDLNKLTPTEISLQMDDKSAAIPIGICKDVPIVVANVTILTDFVILEMPEDDNLSIILGRPFLNIVGAVIDCNKSKVLFIRCTFRRNNLKSTVSFLLEKLHRLFLEVLNFLFLLSKRDTIFLLLGTCIPPLR